MNMVIPDSFFIIEQYQPTQEKELDGVMTLGKGMKGFCKVFESWKKWSIHLEGDTCFDGRGYGRENKEGMVEVWGMIEGMVEVIFEGILSTENML